MSMGLLSHKDLMGLEGLALPEMSYFFFCHCDKIPRQKRPEGERVCFSSRSKAVHCGEEVKRAELKAAAHIRSKVRGEAESMPGLISVSPCHRV